MMSIHTVETPEQRAPEQEPRAVAVSLSRTARQHTLRNIGLIIAHEYKNRLRQRSFIISTILILILIALGSCVPTILRVIASTSLIPTAQTKIVVINEAGSIAGMNTEALLRSIDTTLNATPTQATAPLTPGQSTADTSRLSITAASADMIGSLKKQVQEGTVTILLVLDRAPNQNVHFTSYINTNAAGTSTLTHIQAFASQLSVHDRASRLGLTPEQTSTLLAAPEFSMVNVGQAQNTRSQSEVVAGYIIAYVGILLIFMSIYLYGYGVATGVAEEKSSRIMEILVNAATPFQLLAGKIMGIGAAGLTQMAAFVFVGIGVLLLQTPLQAALFGSSSGGLNVDITGVSITLLLLLLVYFILGFLLYASLFAAVGALVKRQDEVQNAVQLPTWLFMVGYFVSFVGISSPNAVWVKVISYIPFWTPTTMLMRIGTGSVAWWEIALSIVLMLIAIFFCTTISARIYRFGILMYGQKPGLGKLIKLVRMQ
jgi:ABC-2 type transport system permease protein